MGLHLAVASRAGTAEPTADLVVAAPQHRSDQAQAHQRGTAQAPVALRVEITLTLQAERDPLLAPAHLRTGVVEVDDRCLRVVAHAPPMFADPVAPLHVLPVHEQALV